MEATEQKSLERVISQKAMQMSSSFPCKMCSVGFISGVCITYLFLVAFTPRTAEVGFIYPSPSAPIKQESEAMRLGNLESDTVPKSRDTVPNDEKKAVMLYSAWREMLDDKDDREMDSYGYGGIRRSNIPQAPHLENCKISMKVNKQLDSRGTNGTLPPWTLWRGLMGLELATLSEMGLGEQTSWKKLKLGGNPPWIVGSDEDNYPYTRRVQRDLWSHQHPRDCRDPNLRFLIAEWERLPGFGMGAQLAGMAGLLAIAINEKRILVTDYYNRADHNGCQGSSRSHWSCYFFLETSQECRDHAFNLMKKQEAWDSGIVTAKSNYTTKEIWTGRIPRVWGQPWNHIQPTTDVDGNLLMHHRKMDRRWWRAQSIRYFMRFQSEYTCGLLNVARHEAFGLQAARMVVSSLPEAWPEVSVNRSKADMEQFVWSNNKPWIPRPFLSMHVRMGDKACEMKVVNFKTYMSLAQRIRDHFPNLNNIWLSTEMQEVIEKTKLYPSWNFYYTKVSRQAGNITMATYEASLGREVSTNYPLVNFIMATEADFFIGALGSTWCFLIDGMRNTGGKVMAGYLSVNKDRFW